MNLLTFRNVYPPARRFQILWSPKEGLKKSFPTVLNNLCHCNNHRSRDTSERNWRRPFMYFAVLGVVNATENEQKTPKGDFHICRPSEEDTPPYRFNVRTSNGSFAKSKEKDLHADLYYKKLKEGFKSWAAKRKLEFENSSDENEPPSKCLTRAAEVRFEMRDLLLIIITLLSDTRAQKFLSLFFKCQAAESREECIPHGSRIIDLDIFRDNLKQCCHCQRGKSLL